MASIYDTKNYNSDNEVMEKRAPFTEGIESANRQLADIAVRIEAVADRICGGVRGPQNTLAGGAVPTAVPNGLVESIEDTGREQLRRIETIRSELSRIESVLP
jgi:hypothetical protein